MIKRPLIKLLSVDDVIRINPKLGIREQIMYACLDRGRVESAVLRLSILVFIHWLMVVLPKLQVLYVILLLLL